MKYVKIFSLVIISVLLIIGSTYFISIQYINSFSRLFATFNIEDCYLNKITVEVPESYELIQIAFSLTETFQNDRSLLHKNTNYYKDVEEHFSKYKNHKLITEINRYIKNNSYGPTVGNARVQSLFYDISDDNTLIGSKMIKFNIFTPLYMKLNWSRVFTIGENKDLIEDFAQKTDFINFYNNHKSYYSKLIQNYNQLCDFKDMQEWLELKFPNKYPSYRIVFSPLTWGYHNTHSIRDEKKEISQSIMFVQAPDEDLKGLTEKEFEIKAGGMARVVFTEIDHNYVNPVSDLFRDSLQLAIPDYKFWNSGNGYNDSYSTFNEYMTWGVFSLYALDTYSKQNVDTIIQIPANQMNKGRGFNQFLDFNNELIAQYKANNKPKIPLLYEPMLAWMKTHYARGRFKGIPVMLRKATK